MEVDLRCPHCDEEDVTLIYSGSIWGKGKLWISDQGNDTSVYPIDTEYELTDFIDAECDSCLDTVEFDELLEYNKRRRQPPDQNPGQPAQGMQVDQANQTVF